MTTYERLTMAIDRIKTKGWTTWTLRTEVGEGCLIGSALTDYEVDGLCRLPLDLQDLAWETRDMRAVIGALGFKRVTELTRWNDTKGRTKEEVLARLEAARDKVLHEELNQLEAESAMENEGAPCLISSY
jgi:hypothetical protein